MTSAEGGQGAGALIRLRRVRGRVGLAVAVAALVSIVGGWAYLGTSTPLVTVATASMVPTLKVGDIAVLERLRRPPRVGDIVQAPVPVEVQQTDGYPSTVTHRVISIVGGMVTTKGDANSTADPFSVPVHAIRLRLVTVVPGAAKAVRFLLSPFGLAWLVIGALIFLGPSLVEILRGPPVAAGAGDPAVLATLVAAVTEYGEHLKSHTAAVQAMADAAQDLSAIAADLRAATTTTSPVDPFERGLQQLRAYRETEQGTLAADHITADGFALGAWVAEQRRALRAQELRPRQAAALKTLGVGVRSSQPHRHRRPAHMR